MGCEPTPGVNMRTRNWSALTVSLVLVGTVFLTPSSQEAAERPEVHFVSHGTTPAPIEKDLGRIEEILQMERERSGRIVPMTAKASTPVSEPCRSHPNLEPGDPPDRMVVESIEICGKFVGDPEPLKELIASKIESRPGDRLDPEALKKDVRAVWSLGRVDSLRVGTNKGQRGIILVFEVEERD